MNIRKTIIPNNINGYVTNKIDNILLPAQLFAKSYGLRPFKIISIDNDYLKTKLLNEVTNEKMEGENTHLIIFAIKPLITNAHINIFFKDLKILKKLTGNSLNNYRRHIEGIIQNGGENWTSKQAHMALNILSSSAKQAEAEITVFSFLNTLVFDRELELEKEGLTTHIAVKIVLRTSKSQWTFLSDNKN